MRDIAGDLVEQVELIDEYENDAKFGADKKSYAYRIIYRSSDRTLTNEEVDVLHNDRREDGSGVWRDGSLNQDKKRTHFCVRD